MFIAFVSEWFEINMVLWLYLITWLPLSCRVAGTVVTGTDAVYHIKSQNNNRPTNNIAILYLQKNR